MIEMGAAFAQPEGNVSQAAARRGFGGYGPGKRQKTGKAEVRQDEMLEQLIRLWKGCMHIGWTLDNYDKILDRIRSSGLDYSAEDVARFSFVLSEFGDRESFKGNAGRFLRTGIGLFLSALINNGDESDYIIRNISFSGIDNLGYRNRKNIILIGSVRDYVGREMRSGSITIEENAGNHVGYWMKSGSIVVKGNAGYHVGHGMEGGSIIVKGNAGDVVGAWIRDSVVTVEGNVGNAVGWNMTSGEIHLGGGYGSVCEIDGGRIYHKGKLISGND